ncbi:MAG: hypothetical protein MK101_05920 [Phycisphaerales bacterium]|nr:hypothetical protein [Phycisphaerales bacterium]
MNDNPNKLLIRVLEEMLAAHRKASSWVHEEAQLEATGEVLMGELVSGDLRAIERCLEWAREYKGAIPARPVPGETPRTWRLELNESAAALLEPRSREMLLAMHHLLFGGPEPLEDSGTWEDLSALGLPPGLREDIERS